MLAETVSIDTGDVVAILAVLLAVFLGAVTIAVAGIVSGLRVARDPTLTGSDVAWWVCVVVEAAAVVLMLISLGVGAALAGCLLLGLTLAARLLPRRSPLE